MYELYGKQSHNTYFTNKPAFTTTKVLILQVIDYNSFVLNYNVHLKSTIYD